MSADEEIGKAINLVILVFLGTAVLVISFAVYAWKHLHWVG